MPTRPLDRWELGSHFESTELSARPEPVQRPAWQALFATARGAMSSVIDAGVAELGWRVLYVPTYYCPDAYPRPAGPIAIRTYECGPETRRIALAPPPGSVVLSVSYFGQPPAEPPGDTAVLLDATHDPWAPWLGDVPADVVVASLRKTLPVSDGAGVVVKPGVPIPKPQPLTAAGRGLIAERQDAMLRKAAYLRGEPAQEMDYWEDYQRTEREYEQLQREAASPETTSALPRMPVGAWRSARLANIQALTSALPADRSYTMVPGTLGVVLLFDDRASRDSLRSWLIGHRVYPAILWQQTHRFADSAGQRFADRHLLIPADFRYKASDMARVARVVEAWPKGG